MSARVTKNLLSTALIMLLVVATYAPSHASTRLKESITFPETGQTVQGRFLSTWQQGGLAQFGYPISGEMQERSFTDNKLYTVQYFERAIFELHPENRPPFDVLLSLVGTSEYRTRYGRTGVQGQTTNSENRHLFSETGKSIGGRFRAHWESNGGLYRFGYPLTDEFHERSTTDGNTYLVQYFERAIFQYHPENKDPHKVLLGLLGRSAYAARYASTGSTGVGSLQAAANSTVGRACQTATLLPDGKVLVAGGIDNSESPLNTAELFDPASGRFSATGSMMAGRACHTATLLSTGKVLIAGGAGRNALASAELYDPATGDFSVARNMVVAHQGHRATLLPGGKVLITGGGDGSNGDVAELYSPDTGTFSETGRMTSPRNAHTATLLTNGKVLITGGSSGRASVLSSAELYDPATGNFTVTGAMAQVRHKHAAELLPDGKVLVLGGSDSRDWRGRYSSAEVYDPSTGRFDGTGRMSQSRFKLTDAVTILRNGQVLVVGGGTKVELFDPARGAFAPANGDMDAERFYMTATPLQDGRVLVLGGYDTGIRVSSRAWIYQP